MDFVAKEFDNDVMQSLFLLLLSNYMLNRICVDDLWGFV
jgi:hypothetical protein